MRGAKPTTLTGEQESLILSSYPSKSTNEIASVLGLSNDIVIGFLKRRGTYLGFDRRIGSSVDRRFFRWSSDFAYVFGYMCADGSMGEYPKTDSDGRKKRRLTYCSITSKDEQILKDIGKRMGLKMSPKVCVKRKHQRTMETARYWCLSTSCRWVFDKWAEHGLRPRKSYEGMNVPKVPKEFVKHFVRGFFDGDGSKSKNGYSVSFGGTDRRFMLWLRDVVVGVIGGRMPSLSEEERKTRFFRFSVYADRAGKLLEWMSPGESDLRLERKWQKQAA